MERVRSTEAEIFKNGPFNQSQYLTSDGNISGGVIGEDTGRNMQKYDRMVSISLSQEEEVTSESNFSDCHLSELSQVSRDKNGKPIEIELCKLQAGQCAGIHVL